MILSYQRLLLSEDDDSADDEDDPAELYNILADCLTETEQDKTEA